MNRWDDIKHEAKTGTNTRGVWALALHACSS
jgi:hypothetical protein